MQQLIEVLLLGAEGMRRWMAVVQLQAQLLQVKGMWIQGMGQVQVLGQREMSWLKQQLLLMREQMPVMMPS